MFAIPQHRIYEDEKTVRFLGIVWGDSALGISKGSYGFRSNQQHLKSKNRMQGYHQGLGKLVDLLRQMIV